MPTNVTFLTVFSSDNGYGWTEKHVRQSSSDTPNLQQQQAAFLANIIPLRAGLLGQDCKIGGLRVSYPRAGAVASLGLRAGFNGAAGQSSSAPAVSLAIQWLDSTYTQSKITHMRGFWDEVEQNGNFTPELAPAWNATFASWKSAMIAGGYGWLSKSPALSSAGNVTNYTVSSGGFVTFELDDPGIPAGLVGQVISVRFSRLNHSKSPLNRALLVYVNTQLSVTTIYPVGTGPFQAQGRFNYRGTSFTSYAATSSISVGERRMGRPLNRYPGRAKARPLY